MMTNGALIVRKQLSAADKQYIVWIGGPLKGEMFYPLFPLLTVAIYHK
jgi:hypothetical protein